MKAKTIPGTRGVQLVYITKTEAETVLKSLDKIQEGVKALNEIMHNFDHNCMMPAFQIMGCTDTKLHQQINHMFYETQELIS